SSVAASPASSLAAMAASRRQRTRDERRLKQALPLLACFGCLAQTGTGFVGHVPRTPNIFTTTTATATSLHQHDRRSWGTTTAAAGRPSSGWRLQGRARAGGVSAATDAAGSAARGSLFGARRPPPSSTSKIVGGGAAGRRSTLAISATAADSTSSSSTSSSGGGVEVAPEKPRRRRGLGRKTLAAAAKRSRTPVPESTKVASYEIAQAASAGRQAAIEAMEREEADRNALDALAGEQRKELQASVARGDGPTVLVSREGFVP
ncbi:unnamed protein product, partial [Ectocarpus sp. 13 AM-2016]